MAHAEMLGKTGIISADDTEKIISGLKGILEDIESGKLRFDETSEDIHTFTEGELTARIGDAGKRLHTARSRNDQVALDIRLYLRDECDELTEMLKSLVSVLAKKAEEYSETVMPGYTHLQRARRVGWQPHLHPLWRYLLCCFRMAQWPVCGLHTGSQQCGRV